MQFSLKISFILFIIYLKAYFIKSNSDLNNDNQNDTYKTAIKYFPISYLAYIIKGFLPKKGDSNFLGEAIANCSCFKSLTISNNPLDIKKVHDSIKYSAKSYPDFGNEEGCINEKYAFLLFSIKFNINNPNEYNGKFKLLPFISNGHSFYGLCLENNTNCTTDLTKMLDIAINQNSLFNQTFNLKTFINYLDSKKEIKNNIKLNIYSIQLVLFVIYFLIRIVICIVALKFFKEDDLNNKKKGNDSSSSDEEEEEEEEQEDNQQKENIEKKSGQLLLEKNNVVNISKKEKYPKFFFFVKFCSFKLGFKYLFKNKSNLYDESDLYSIIFFKFMSLILKTFYMNLHSLIYIPSKEINNINFFNGNFIIFMKYSSFSDVIFIIAESIIVSYKLMSFIRKYTEKNKEPSLKLFINFFFRIIPSFFTVFIIFFVFYFLCEEMMYVFYPADLFYRTRLQYLRDKLTNCDCVNNWKALIPFYIQYNNFNEQILQEKECFKFIIFMTNMFYCYLIVILLTYISFKIKRKIYDYFIIIIFLINYIIPNNFSCKSLTDQTKYSNINILFGETCSIKFTHLFIKYYFFGFLIGLSIFYNNDITHEKSIQNSSIYKPFHFLQDIIGYIYLRSFISKLIIIILTIIIQGALSFSFFYYLNIQELNLFDDSLYLNEKTIFAFVFGLMIIIFYTFENESVFKGFCNNSFTILLNRIGFGYYSLIEIIINYIYCFVELEVQLNYVNFIFITTGIIFYILLFNIILYVLNEIPLKILIKNMFHIKVEERLGYKI